MAWTTEQLQTIESAIMALAGGAEEVQIGDKRWRKSSLKELRALREEMQTEIQLAASSGIQKVSFKNKALI